MQDLKIIENELVPVYETSTGEKVVYGTELHDVLGVNTKYADWITRRFKDIDAVENDDYETCFSNLSSKMHGGKNKKDHIIKLDTAKEMAMLERNEKGKQVRRYFIQIEKKYRASSQVTDQVAPVLLETFQKFMEMQIEFMKRQEEFNRSIEKKIESFDRCLPDHSDEDFAYVEKEFTIEERKQYIYELVNENADLRDMSVNQILHMMYNVLEKTCSISLNAYRSVYRSETDKPQAGMIEVIAAHDWIYELAIRFNNYLLKEHREKETMEEA